MNDGDRRATRELQSLVRNAGAGREAAGEPRPGGHGEFLVFDEGAQREFENSASPMRIFDMETLRYLAVNSAAVKFYGYTREEFLSLTVSDTRHPEDRDELAATVAEQAGYLRHRPACRQVKKSGEIAVVERITQDVLFHGRKARLTLTIDITGRLHMQELIWQRQQEFETLAEHSPDIVSRLDRGYRHLYVNSAVTAATGRPPREFVGKTVSEVGMPPELVARWRAVLDQAFANGEEQKLECVFTGPNGERHYESRIIPERGSSGGIETVLVVTRDFTERKKAENELQRQKNLLAAIIDNLPVGVFIRDAETLRYVARNRFLEESNGYPVESSLGKSAHDLFPKEQADQSVATDREALGSRNLVDIPEQEMLSKAGGQRVFHVRKVPLLGEDGRPQLLVGIADDITDRKRAESALREGEERFNLAVENTGLGMWDWNVRTSEVWRHPHWARMLGYEPGEVRGHICMWREFCHPDDWDGAHAKLMAHMEGGAPGYGAEYRMRKKDGTWLWVVCRGKVVERDGDGAPLRMIGYIQDISERKQFEDAQRESERQLAADLDAMTRLQQVGSLYLREAEMQAVLGEIVEAAIAITGADMGNIQILDTQSGCLRIAAQRGFDKSWLDYWERVAQGQGACGSALERGERVIVEDISRSPYFAGTPGLQVQLNAGVRAVQSTPLVSRSGQLLGVFSTHYKTPRRPDERALRLLDLLARQTADMIERAHAESALAGSEARFRQLAENIRQVFWITTLSLDKMVYVSPAYEEIWGRSRDSLYAAPRSWLEAVHPEDRPRVEVASLGIAEGRMLDVEYRVIRPDGTLRWIRDRSYLIKTGDGSSLACGIAEDITDLKLAEQEKLIHAIHQRDALVREIHHRIKNSLQGVVGLLRQKIRKYPAVARDMEEAIGQLQSVALVYGLQETRPDGLLSLAEITDAICSSAEKLIGGRVGRHFERESLEHACIAGAEAVSVAVALNELVFNALKHQPAQAGRKRAKVTLREASGAAEICISNRGYLPNSFDFAEGRAVGYGLGLVRTLLSPPGGTITFNGGRDRVEVKVTLAAPLLARQRKAHAR